MATVIATGDQCPMDCGESLWDIMYAPEEPKLIAARIAAGEKRIQMPLEMAVKVSRELEQTGHMTTLGGSRLKF